ncbi:MAG TPA: head GIN domain-containing protein [Bacteroidales bacterium]|nr:head GIN domain-containing protein [Bacteroidales bacterium]HPS27063.1 head GIN domain-containing protein [Bacteroidales bacterium]
MKKIIYLTVIIFFTSFICSITSCMDNLPVKGNGAIIKKEIQLTEFDKIELDGIFKVILKQGDQAKLEVETDENLLDCLRADVSNSTLKIKLKKPVHSTHGINIYVTFNKISNIAVAGHTYAISSDKLNFDRLDVAVSGTSKMIAEINAVSLNMEASGNSSVIFSGNVFSADITASGTANFDAANMNIDDLDLSASGNAAAIVNVITTFDVSASGNAKVLYKGTPEMEESVSGSASVNKKY